MSGADAVATERILARKRARALDAFSLATLFEGARTATGFLPIAVPRELLAEIVRIAQFAPTSNNSQPMRLVFVESAKAKARLRPALSPGNVAKMLSAPVTAIVAVDTRFHEHFERLAGSAKPVDTPERIAQMRGVGTTSATLQGAYVMLAARALGLDVGPMGGFDRAAVDAEFFAEGRFASLFLANLGYADESVRRERKPRLTFEEIATFA